MERIAVAALVALALAAPAAAQLPVPYLRPAKLVLVQPCRFMDTRTGVAPLWCGVAGPFHNGETRECTVRGNYCPQGSTTVPVPGGLQDEVLGLLYTVTVVRATGPGDLVIYDATLFAAPVHSTINFSPGAAVANTGIVALGQWHGQTIGIPFAPDIKIKADVAGGGQVDVIIDLLGYLVPAP